MNAYRDYRDIPWRRYGLIMCDPAWLFQNRSEKGEGKNPVSQYDCMTLEEIQAMPVSLMAADDCILWLWATNPMLDVQMQTLKGWGFEFVTSGHWAKFTKNGKQHFGTGYCLRGAGEPYLIGKIGKPKFSASVRSVVLGKVRENSRKPEEAYEAAERLAPEAEHRLDMFTRQRRPGWDAFGNQYDEFEELTWDSINAIRQKPPYVICSQST